MSYYTKITTAGLAAITAAMNNSSKVPITYMAFGDGNGYVPDPDENATSLVNEVYRVGVNKVEVHSKNPNWLVCEAIIPSAVGGFNIREVALYDSTGNTMLAIASYPPTYKPTVEEGAAKIQTIRIVIQVDNSGNFELIVDPDVVLATIDYVDKKLSSSMTVVNKYEDLERIANPIHNMIVNVFGKGSYKFDSISRLWIPEKHIDNLFVFIDDIVSSNDGSLDCSSEINQTIQKLKGRHVTLLGNPNSIYRLDSTLELIGVNDITLDFRWATIIDNVQGYIPNSGNRGAHTFVIHDAEDITVKRFNYTCLPTRANSIATTNIPANVFWVGGQYLGGAMTSNVKIHDLKFESGGFEQGFIICALGELDGLDVRRISVKGGNWGCGINAEYGLRSTDSEVDKNLANGRHPYNIYVEEFKGENLLNSKWFLRVASCYNIKFFNCTGFNVPNFIYYYSGDRGISRYNQNVTFENCKAKFDDTVSVAQYCVQIIVTVRDGSTGEVLPAWTNRNHQIKFTMCEFIGNYTPQMTGLRFYGAAGKVVFDNCTFKRFHRGIHTQYIASTNPNTPSPFVLSFRDCLFIKNNTDVLQVDTAGVLYDHCTFKNRVVGNGEGYQIDVLNVIGNCAGTTFRNCNVSDQPVSATPMRVNSKGVYLDSNNFDLFNTSTVALTSTEVVRGTNNQTNGKLTGDGESVIRVIGDVPKVKVFANANADNSLNYDSSGVWLIRTTRTIEKILGGEVGDVIHIRAEFSTSDVTFVYNSTNATTSTRLLNKSGVTDSNVVGSGTSRSYMKFADGWREM